LFVSNSLAIGDLPLVIHSLTVPDPLFDIKGSREKRDGRSMKGDERKEVN
jgi:hypothetical protein